MYTMPIERGKIREFARAVMAPDPAYDAPDAVVPPTFLTTASLTWEPPDELDLGDVELDLRRVLHGEEEFVFHGPLPRAGQTLEVTSRLGDVYRKPGRRGGDLTFVTIVREFRSPAGELVAEQRTTLVQTSKSPQEVRP
ncbi:MaoC family dehydratase N-terminal domain-containing protein [Kribbella sp. NPDC051952]|uniref:FAS1-like dehydratase domain-containing protein n=1 Tax=Kribbella sp. NPDC051952 TaxID=3154851 RepID=UPI00342A378B